MLQIWGHEQGKTGIDSFFLFAREGEFLEMRKDWLTPCQLRQLENCTVLYRLEGMIN
jgi:hypothetical protein